MTGNTSVGNGSTSAVDDGDGDADADVETEGLDASFIAPASTPPLRGADGDCRDSEAASADESADCGDEQAEIPAAMTQATARNLIALMVSFVVVVGGRRKALTSLCAGLG